jgi:V-type H+-transporting ATPase subunit a
MRMISPHLPSPQIQEIVPSVTPPTHFRSNTFLSTFHLIVNTYGVPSYREINPALFSIITFPFLFGVMFGDIAHGMFLLMFGVYLSYTKSFSPIALQKQQRE